MKYYVTVAGRPHEVTVVEQAGELRVSLDGAPVEVSYHEVDRLGQVAMAMEGASFGVSIEGDATTVDVSIAGRDFRVEIEDERERAAHAAERQATQRGGVVKSVMPGVVVKVLVTPGEEVRAGQPLLILEAMKMQNEIAAPADAVVREVHAGEGRAVRSGERLVTLE